MDIIRAHGLFAMRRAQSLNGFEMECTVEGMDAWPAACVAGVMLAGRLDDACSDEDLTDALGEFLTDYNAGIVSDDEWRKAIADVIESLLLWGDAQAESMGGMNAVN